MDPQLQPHDSLGDERVSLWTLGQFFLKLGIIGFGGPAAHIALMEDEVVRRRKWIDQQEFLDLLGATNLIPGPTSTEMTLHIGLRKRGFPGMCVAGFGFILPAALLSALFAWAYVRYGTIPQARDALTGVQAAVLALIAVACYNLGKTAAKSRFLIALGAAAAAASFFGLPEIAVLLACGIIGAALARPVYPQGKVAVQIISASVASTMTGNVLAATATVGTAATVGAAATISTLKLGLGFLGIGSILYGSGYVLFAFLEDWLVHETGLLTAGQLTDAIAVGQFTPGPVSSTATFIGYILNGGPGAVGATLGMFLPSFIFVLLLGPWLPRLRQSVRAAGFLDAVNIAAVALIAVVTIKLGLSISINWIVPLMAVICLILLLKQWVNPTLLIIASGLLGWIAGITGLL